MASVLQQYHQLADRMATQITGSYQSWTDFLTTAARLYKYPYHEQLMIYAQRPEATACAEYDLWNNRMGRYIRRGAKGIALIDHSGDAPKLKYVFDVADTRSTERSRSPYLWEYRSEHENPDFPDEAGSKVNLCVDNIAFLVSPMGIPMIAAHLLAGVQHISSAIKNL